MKDTFKQGQKTTLIAGAGTVSFSILKAIIGTLSGSVVLVADAIHSAADAFSTFLAWIGLKFSQKDPTEKFPYGFYKAENIASFVISFLIFYAGFNIITESISKLHTSYELGIPYIAIGAAAIDGIVMYFIGTYEMHSGQEINSQSLIADGKESRLHLLSSGVVLIGLLGSFFSVAYIEGIAGIIISLFIFEAGYESLRDSIFVLLDESPSEEIEKKIAKILEDISGIQAFENLKLRKSGPYIFGEVTAKIRKTVNVQKADEISKQVEEQIKEKISRVDSFSVKIASYQTDKQKIAIPITNKDQALESKIAGKFGRAEAFIFIQTEKDRIQDFYTKENPHRDKKVRAGLKVAEWIVKEDIDSVITDEMGPISLHTLKDNIVTVFQTKDNSIEKNIKAFADQNLEKIKEPTKER